MKFERNTKTPQTVILSGLWGFYIKSANDIIIPMHDIVGR